VYSDQAAKRFVLEDSLQICHESIYRHIYTYKFRGGDLWRRLGARGCVEGVMQIPGGELTDIALKKRDECGSSQLPATQSAGLENHLIHSFKVIWYKSKVL